MYNYWVRITVVNLRQIAFNRRESLQDVLCRRDYAERLVASFSHQIKPEYYVGNISVSIDGKN